ncbi:MAG: DUF1080 domain-containing protein [Planctomycetes bacterium]|nr:DUF1080 domain-containing protein [Planctomycetota bacterium]
MREHTLHRLTLLCVLLSATSLGGAQTESDEGFTLLFPDDGVPQGWTVRRWNDVSLPAAPGVQWRVQDGILTGSDPRLTWLMSEREYTNFILKYDFRLGTRGNSGCALRAPLSGDPAFDGMELQMADLRYNPRAKPSELTGGIYRAIPPKMQVYQPTQWNSVEVRLMGPRLRVTLNGQLIHELNLDEQSQVVKRHNGSSAPPVKSRPRKGHIGFQELSRGNSQVQIRDARIKVLDTE